MSDKSTAHPPCRCCAPTGTAQIEDLPDPPGGGTQPAEDCSGPSAVLGVPLSGVAPDGLSGVASGIASGAAPRAVSGAASGIASGAAPRAVSGEQQGEASAASKPQLRAHMSRLRREQPAELAARRARAAQERLLDSPFWQQAASVTLYVGIKDELGTSLLLEQAWSSGRLLWLPRVRRGSKGIMDFVACAGRHQLRPGPLGLLEPDAALPGVGPEAISAAVRGNGATDQAAAGRAGLGSPPFLPDLMIIPGLAFDLSGGRLGYGGGYYDRFLQAGLDCPRMGLCFDFQLVSALPLDPWDQRVHYLCTEERLLCP